MTLDAAVLSADGTRVIRESRSGDAADAAGLGVAAAESLLERGAASLIAEVPYR